MRYTPSTLRKTLYEVTICMTLSSCTILQPNSPPKGSGKIILTFDDGPAPASERLLDVLNKHHVKATFCYIGANVAKYPDTARRAYAEGHIIANHTQTHRRPLFLPSSLDQDIRKADTTLQQTLDDTKFKTTLFRPPYGLKTPAVLFSHEASIRRTAYLTFFIDDSSTDRGTAKHVMDHIKKTLLHRHGGAIVLHEMRYPSPQPSKEWLPEAVDDLIAWAKANDLTFTHY